MTENGQNRITALEAPSMDKLAAIHQQVESLAAGLALLAAYVERLAGRRGDAPWRFQQ